jgi:hypothetical protein
MPVPEPEAVMELASELKEARNRVAELESRWESFFSQNVVVHVATPQLGSMNLKPRIIQFLEERPAQSFNLASVAKALDAKENSVGPYLSVLTNERKIERRGHGLYGALSAKAEVSDDDIPF